MPLIGSPLSGSRSVSGDCIESLDALRGVAAFLVAILHFKLFLLKDLDFGWLTNIVINGYLWVDFFFILSGFVPTHVYRDSFTDGIRTRPYRAFVGARLARIYPVHVATLALLAILELGKLAVTVMLRHPMEQPPFSGRNVVDAIVTNLLLIHGWNLHDSVTWNVPSWSISAEWAVYLICPMLLAALARCSWMAKLLLAAACVAAICIITIGRPDGLLTITYDLGVLRCLFGFIIGMLLNDAYRLGRMPAMLRRDWAFLAALSAALAPMALDLYDVVAIPGFAAMVLMAAVNHGAVSRILTSGLMAWIGTLSYSIYLCHWVVLQAANQAWKLVYREALGTSFSSGRSAIALIGLMATTLGLASGMSRMVEMPGRRWLRARLCGGAAGPEKRVSRFVIPDVH